jgi:hypothetical protein
MMSEERLQGYLGSLPIQEAAEWKQRLDHHRTDCGCRVAAMMMLAGTAAWIAYSVFVPATEFSWQRTAVSGFVVLWISGLVGKLMGLVLARMRFHFMVRSLRRRASVDERTVGASPG